LDGVKVVAGDKADSFPPNPAANLAGGRRRAWFDPDDGREASLSPALLSRIWR